MLDGGPADEFAFLVDNFHAQSRHESELGRQSTLSLRILEATMDGALALGLLRLTVFGFGGFGGGCKASIDLSVGLLI